MIQTKEAIGTAIKYMTDVYPNVTGFEIEEIELSDTADHWYITISMPDPQASAIGIIAGNSRKYKKVIIDSNDGNVKAMQIRKL